MVIPPFLNIGIHAADLVKNRKHGHTGWNARRIIDSQQT
jgi:hypothetical protein